MEINRIVSIFAGFMVMLSLGLATGWDRQTCRMQVGYG